MSGYDDKFEGQDLSALFADLTPADFFRETSAVDSDDYDVVLSGEQDFDKFVIRHIQRTRLNFDEDAESFQPVAVLSTFTAARVFTPDEDETNEMYMSRLNREAAAFEAMWFAVSMVAPAVVRTDAMQDVICWYAEAREPRFSKIRQGVITIGVGTHGDKVGMQYSDEFMEGSPEGAAALFRSVLEPATRAN
jgi:hypothetical protein